MQLLWFTQGIDPREDNEIKKKLDTTDRHILIPWELSAMYVV